MSRENDDSTKDETGLEAPLECVVCLMTFDLDDHLPKSLRCGHTVCQLCMTKLTKHATVSCPTCRHDSSLQSDVKTNYALKNILENLCPECKQQKPCGQCRHCDLRLCADCRRDYVQTYASDVSAQIHSLQTVVKLAQETSFNETYEDDQRRKKEKAIAKLHDIERRNLDRLHEWSSELNDKSAAAVAFIHSSKGQLRKDVNDFPAIKEVGDQCKLLLGELEKLTSGPSHLAEYSFQFDMDQDAAQTSVVINQLPSAGHSVTSTPAADPPTPEIADDVSHPSSPQVPLQVRPKATAQGPTQGPAQDTAPRPAPKNRINATEDAPVAIALVPSPSTMVQSASSKPAKDPPRLEKTDAAHRTSPSLPVNTTQDSGVVPGAAAIAKVPPPITPSSIYKQMRFQRMTGSNPSLFNEPESVICVNKTIFVTDWENDQIKQLDFDLNILATIGGPKRFLGPDGIAHNGQGMLFVTDQRNRVKVINLNGDTVGKFTTGFNLPLGIVSAMNGELFICDSDNYRVRVVKEDGTHVRDIGSKGHGPAQFQSDPTRLAITKTNTLLVKTRSESKLSHFSMTGDFLGLWPPTEPETFKDVVISTVAVDPVDGHVLIAYKNDMVGVYTAEGAFVCAFGSHGIGPAQFNNVTGLAVSENRDVFVCDSVNHRIQKWGVSRSSSQ